MSYYDALVAKWATLTGNTADKLAAVNALTVAGPTRAVPIAEVMTYLRSNGLWLPIKAAQASSVGAAAAVDLNDDLRMQTIDFSLPIVGAMLADLVSHNLLTADQITALNALALSQVLWWQSAGYERPFDLGDIAAAGLN